MAHVWDAEAKKWWRCDDEAVIEMPKGPVAERGDHGVAPEKKVCRYFPLGAGDVLKVSCKLCWTMQQLVPEKAYTDDHMAKGLSSGPSRGLENVTALEVKASPRGYVICCREVLLQARAKGSPRGPVQTRTQT